MVWSKIPIIGWNSAQLCELEILVNCHLKSGNIGTVQEEVKTKPGRISLYCVLVRRRNFPSASCSHTGLTPSHRSRWVLTHKALSSSTHEILNENNFCKQNSTKFYFVSNNRQYLITRKWARVSKYLSCKNMNYMIRYTKLANL